MIKHCLILSYVLLLSACAAPPSSQDDRPPRHRQGDLATQKGPALPLPHDGPVAYLQSSIQSSDILPDNALSLGITDNKQCTRFYPLAMVNSKHTADRGEVTITTGQPLYLRMQGRTASGQQCMGTLQFVPQPDAQYLLVAQSIDPNSGNAQLFQRVFGGLVQQQCAMAILQDMGNKKQVAIRSVRVNNDQLRTGC